MMKKTPIYILVMMAIAASLLTACGGGDAAHSSPSDIDSLKKVADVKQRQYDELSDFVTTIVVSLDSINQAENLLVNVVNSETGTVNRETVRQQVNQLAVLIQRQKDRINSLSDSLKMRGTQFAIDAQMIAKLNNMVEYFKGQLASKDRQLKQLQTQLVSSKASVAQLRTSVSSLKSNVSTLKEDVSKLESKNEKLDNALTVQDEVINECYVKIGSKKELEAAGILKGGGFLRKKKVDYNSFSSAGFNKVDIRKFRSHTFAGKKAKMLTVAPSGSYTLVKSGNKQWTLTISNPNLFWSVSNYLVIQTD